MAEPTPPQVEPPRSTTRAGRSPRAIVIFLVIVTAVLGGDLLLKSWAFAHVADRPVVLRPDQGGRGMQVPYHKPRVVVPYVLDLQLTLNRGAVFGIGQGRVGLFVVVSIGAIGVIGWMFCRSRARAWGVHLAMALILAGALGNLYDRIVFGAVRDMLKLFPGVLLPFGWAWPAGGASGGASGGGGSREVYPWVFNLADVALVCGVLLVMVLTWKADSKEQTDPAGVSDTPAPETGSPPS